MLEGGGNYIKLHIKTTRHMTSIRMRGLGRGIGRPAIYVTAQSKRDKMVVSCQIHQAPHVCVAAPHLLMDFQKQ